MTVGIEAQRLWRHKKHGIDLVALELTKHIQAVDKENNYIVFVKKGDDRCISASERFQIAEASAAPYPVWEQLVLPRMLRRHKVELLHCTANTAPLVPGVPCVLTLHDVIFLDSQSGLSPGGTLYQQWGNRYRKWIVPSVLKKCRAIITVSEYEKRNILRIFPSLEGRVYRVYNSAGEHFRRVTDKEVLTGIRMKFNLPDQYMLYFGNTDPKKNTKNVILAYGQYTKLSRHPLPLIMIDYRVERLFKILKENDLLRLQHLIRPLGYVANHELPAFYSLCSYFLYPSIRESFGIPILEAMKCGAPVITSDVSAMPEIAGNAAIYTNPHSPENMANAMHQLDSQPNLCEELIEKGYERSTQFSWQTSALQVIHIYKELTK